MAPRLFDTTKKGFNFVTSFKGITPPDLSWINNERRKLGLQLQGTAIAGAENDDEFFMAHLTLQNQTLPYSVRQAAQATLEKKIYPESDAGSGGGSGPSTAQNAAGIKAELENLAGLFGLPDQDWSDLAWQAASNNWNAAMIRNAVADRINMESANQAGLVKNVITKSRDVAANYLVGVNDEEALGWAKRIARGEMEEESIVAQLRDRAKAQYYWLAPVIDQGVTLKEYFQPHRQTIAKLMEVSEDSVDLINNPKWRNVVRYMPPEQNGVREMNLNEVEQYVRNQEEWKATSNAKSSAASASVAIGRIFGAL